MYGCVADAVQINVYKLGHAFLRFKALTQMNVPNIDPCIYIHRFACKLELGNSQEEQKVRFVFYIAIPHTPLTSDAI